ncbi:MAG: tetratricopeptide repeat protein, partial [Holophagales bacterium]|nr:tetratricopeptide repeat protein [Holophagales bacterium]
IRRIYAENDSAYGRYLLGEMLMARGEKEVGERELAAAVELDPGFHRAQLSYGIHLAESGRHGEAEATFEALLRRHPLSERGHFNYAVLLLQTERWDAALEHLERSIELAPSYCPAHLARLAVFVDRGQAERSQGALGDLEIRCRDPRAVARARSMVSGP